MSDEFKEVLSELGFTIVPLLKRVKSVSSIPIILPNDLRYNSRSGIVEKAIGAKRSRLCVVKEACDLLGQISTPISVIAIAGPARTGKSYILSRILGDHNAFSLGSTFDPETYGIWMGTHVLCGQNVSGEPITVVLLDTEGIDAVNAERSQDAGIFILSVLLSSILVYNSQSVPTRNDLDTIRCFSNLASGIQISHLPIQRSQYHDKGHFPELLWLLRDVTLIPTDQEGRRISITDFIKTRVLKPNVENGFSNEAANNMLNLFPSIEAFSLTPPHTDQEVLADIAKHSDKLEKKFTSNVTVLIKKLLMSAKNTQKRGANLTSLVTGEILSIMIPQFVDDVNRPNAIPVIEGAWKNATEVVVGKELENLENEYKKRVQLHLKMLVCEEDCDVVEEELILQTHNMIWKEIKLALDQKVQFLGHDRKSLTRKLDIRRKLEFKLVKKDIYFKKVIGGALFYFIHGNRLKSEEFCRKVYKRHFIDAKEFIEAFFETYQLESLNHDLESLHFKYNLIAKGPLKSMVCEEMDRTYWQPFEDHFTHRKLLFEDEQERASERLVREIQLQDQLEDEQERLANVNRNLRSLHL